MLIFEFLDFERMCSNIKWVFSTQDSIQDCIRRWRCDRYCDLYDQPDETEEEAHDRNACERSSRRHTQAWVVWCTEAAAERSNDS